MGDANTELRLGDIIRLYSPANAAYDGKSFFIDYIDTARIIIVNEDAKHEITIERGLFTDESIESVDIISRARYPGYVRQNGMETGDRVSVYFGGDVPVVLTGGITNIDEDMIEISRVGDDEKFYIDFGYQGVPRDMDIDRIVVKNRIESVLSAIEEVVEAGEVGNVIRVGSVNVDGSETGVGVGEGSSVGLIEDGSDVDVDVDDDDVGDAFQGKSIEFEHVAPSGPDATGRAPDIDINAIIKKSGVLMFGDILDPVLQKFNVPESETRYGIDIQTNDMLNAMKSDDREKRSGDILMQIVRRFKELRTEFSEFNGDGNIDGFVSVDSQYKPVVDSIKNMETNISWLIPVVEQKLKIYDVPANIEDELDDVVVIDGETLNRDIMELRTPKDFRSTADVSGYALYLQGLQRFLTPYVNMDSENLYKADVTRCPIDALVDNDGRFGMTALVDGEGGVRTHRFGMQRYVAQDTKKLFIEMKNELLTHTKLIPSGIPEKMELKSLVTLPLSTVLYERVNCESFSIQDRANLACAAFVPSFFMKYTSNRDEHYVTDLDADNKNKKKLFTAATNHVMDLPDDGVSVVTGRRETYENYFDYVFPTTNEFFHMFKGNMKNPYTIKDVLRELEVFKIQKNQLTFKQYESFFSFINKRVMEYSAEKEKRKIEFNQYKRKVTSGHGRDRDRWNERGDIEKHIDLVVDGTGIGNTDGNINRNTLHEKMRMIDAYGDLFHMGIDKKNMNLNSTKNINESLEYFVGKLEKIKAGDNTCSDEFVVSKEYAAESLVHADDDQEIYHDKKFDGTIYDILEVYKTEQMTMSPPEFKTFLSAKLVDVNGLSKEKAEHDATTLIAGKKRVIDGSYAILQDAGDVGDDTANEVKYSFYKRINSKWVLDSKKTAEYKGDGPIIMETGSDFICNLKSECASTSTSSSSSKDECAPVDSLTTRTKKELVRRMMGEFEHRFYMEKTELTALLDTRIMEGDAKKVRTNQIADMARTKYVNKYNLVASTYEATDVPDTSPYADALELIIGTTDQAQRHGQILRFSNTFTREPSQREDKYWRYCVETNVKLVPMFLHRLAHAFHVGNYVEVLNDIVRDQGRTSDDGDSIVDHHSGKIIKMRDFSGDNEYDSGGFLASAEKVSDDPSGVEENGGSGTGGGGSDMVEESRGEVEMEGAILDEVSDKAADRADIFDMNEATIRQRCDEYVTIIAKKMKVNISHVTREFVIYNTTTTFVHNFGGKVGDVGDNIKLMLITSSLLFIGIQLARTRSDRAYPGCVVSFDGFPLYEDGTDDGLTYMACCISKISTEKRASPLFSSIKSVKPEALKTKLKEIIMKFLLPNLDIKLKLDEKRAMIAASMTEVVAADRFEFLPSLYDTGIGGVKTLPASFYEDMDNVVNAGSTKKDGGGVYIYLNRLKSKNIEIGHIFAKIINDSLKKTDLLLTSFDEPYLENTCCLENYGAPEHVLGYFNKKDPALFKYAEMSRKNTDLHDDFIRRVASSTLASKRTQIAIAPFIQTQFDEKTIYTAFIHYCKWNKTSNMFSLRGDLNDVCAIEDDGFSGAGAGDAAGGSTLDDKIRVLKESGKNLSNAMLLVLANKINKMNIVDLDPTVATKSSVDIFTAFVRDKADHPYISKIVPGIDALTNTFDISMKKTDRFKESYQLVSFIDKATAQLETGVSKFIKSYAVVNVKENRLIADFIAHFGKYDVDPSLPFDTDVFLKKVRNYKTMIYEVSRVVPNIIMNNITHYNTEESNYELVPPYWNLSSTHMKDITEFNKKYYRWMSRFGNNENMTELFNMCHADNVALFHMSELTPIFAPKVDGDMVTYTVFDDVLVTSLYKFYMFSVFDGYIRALEKTTYSVENTIVVRQHLSSYIKDSILHLVAVKGLVNNNYAFVMKKILHYREKEKLRITDRFEEMNDQEREIENELKKNKLGARWGKGLESGLIRYDPNVYDGERAEMDVYAVADERETNDLSFLDDDDGATGYDEY